MKSAIISMDIDRARALFAQRRHDLDETGWEDGRRAAGDQPDDEISESDDSGASDG